jgi:isocitrate dehydrogenase kinase/phosphatase
MANKTIIQSKWSRLTKAERAQLRQDLADYDETIHQLERANIEYGGPQPLKSFIPEVSKHILMHDCLALE